MDGYLERVRHLQGPTVLAGEKQYPKGSSRMVSERWDSTDPVYGNADATAFRQFDGSAVRQFDGLVTV